MTLDAIRDYFKANYNWQHSLSVGKIDQNQERAICFYPSKNTPAKQGVLGGKKNQSYSMKGVTVLLRYGKNAVTADKEAQRVFDFFDELKTIHNNQRVFVISRYQGAMPLGTDDKGVYEYSFEFEFYTINERK